MFETYLIELKDHYGDKVGNVTIYCNPKLFDSAIMLVKQAWSEELVTYPPWELSVNAFLKHHKFHGFEVFEEHISALY